jgi:hypothetical protein
MLYASNIVRTVALWAVGRLLMLDTRISAWQSRSMAKWDGEETLPGKTLRIPKDYGGCNARGGDA